MKLDCKYEYKIKNILEDFSPERYYNLIKSESPDFYNDIVGLEITTATTNNDMELHSFMCQYNNVEKGDIPIKLLQKISKKYNLLFVQNRLIGYEINFTNFYSIIEEIGTILNKKLIKLNKNYSLKKFNDLAIQVRDYFVFYEKGDNKLNKEFIGEYFNLLNKVIYNINKNYKNKFDFIHIVYDNMLITINEKDNYQNYAEIKSHK